MPAQDLADFYQPPASACADRHFVKVGVPVNEAFRPPPFYIGFCRSQVILESTQFFQRDPFQRVAAGQGLTNLPDLANPVYFIQLNFLNLVVDSRDRLQESFHFQNMKSLSYWRTGDAEPPGQLVFRNPLRGSNASAYD
jgi:hypothetical protein